MLKEFKDFIMRGNVMDLAIAVIIGGAFGKIITSLVNDVIMPPIGIVLGHVDFSNLYINLTGGAYATLDDATKAGAALRYGAFLNNVVDFLIVALVIFLTIRAFTKAFPPKPAAPAAPTTKDCPYCLTAIPLKATRCPHCTSQLEKA
jgi:large conductance mechanosensitive channel